jgi:colanic acid biosynthesis glycosyl transferase WcaI
MHLLIIGLNFAPELTGIGKYTGEMAAWFARRGHRITVITSPPYYPSWKMAPGYRSWAWQAESWKGCSVIRCPLYVPHRVTGVRRVAHLGSFALSSAVPALYHALRGKPDLVLAVAPSLLAAPVALAAGRLTSAKTWLHVQDLEIEAAFELGILKSRRVMNGVLSAERRLLSQFDLISTISPKMLEAIERKGVSKERLMLLPNWVDTSRTYPLESSHAFRREFGISADRCVALYSGSMGQKQGLEVIVKAARETLSFAGKSPLFVLAGDGPARQRLEAEAKDLPNVLFLPLQPEERFNELLNAADIHLLPQRLDAADLVMPSKLGAIFATGKPVIASVPPQSQVAIAVGSGGVIVPPEDPTALAAAVRDLIAASDRRHRMGTEALGIAKKWDATVVLGRTEERLLQICLDPIPESIVRGSAL